ncbi:hypothetical protein [Mycobacterium sp. 1274761.0]|uniref:hypothetical protein n=1 Tax=Mycobacterium sp. 1274761.0 TaxID=1834077 RepID=UPI0007FE7163|nr:hypothetical protein [Mycobacterium sp. 1274761.0]OBK76011.1 hypothetical protein A5651_06915 [Mycobacterium sp. 1274761.0]
MTDIPLAMNSPVPLREFIVSPGFAGTAAVIAALIVLVAALYATRRARKGLDRELEQRQRHHQQAHEAEQHAALSRQAWETLKWLVETAGIEPAASEGATLGLGPELAMATLRGLLRDAERLGDETLADAVTVYQSQFALILAQQSGPLSELAASIPATGGGTVPPQPPSPDEQTPSIDAKPLQAKPTQANPSPAVSPGTKAPEGNHAKPPSPAESAAPTTAITTGGRRRKQ